MKELKDIVFEINGWSYSVKVEKEFESYLKSESKKDFSKILPDGRKTLLLAYIKAKYELFLQHKVIEKMIEGIP